MGKVHRIKKAFNRVIAQNPWETVLPGSVKRYPLAGRTFGLVSIYIGVRGDRSRYIGYYSEPYKNLMQKLIREYEAGVAHGDKGPVTG